jgi:glycosyltransferase involved in cell wall biosynthesis
MQSTKPKVSIGLAVYNGEKHLLGAINSLLAQEYQNFELLISDNASTDATAQICQTFARANSRIQYHRTETNIGAAKNFNRVFERSSGKYFMWAAHDDQWSPTYVTKCVDALEKNDDLVLCGTDINFIDESGEAIEYPREFNRLDTCAMDSRQRVRTLTARLDWFAIYSLIRKDGLRNTRLFAEVYGADVILLLELLLKGQSLILPERLFHYRFIPKTAQEHLEDITGTIRKAESRPYTELATHLLQVIADSNCTTDLKQDMRDDLLDNVCQYNEAWSHNIVSENPGLLQVPDYLRIIEIRKLFTPPQKSPRQVSGAAENDPNRYSVRVPNSNVVPRGTFGFNVIGFVSGNLGLGVSTRNTIAALKSRKFPVAVLDLDPGLGRSGFDTRYNHLRVRTPAELPYDVNLLVFPMESIGRFVLGTPDIFTRPDRINVACTFWELSVLPKPWQRALEFFDVIVAFSEFIRHALEFKLSGPSIVSARQPLYLPDGVRAQRERFGIGKEDVVFVTSLEFGSDPLRKNAHSIIEAFLKGLKDAPNARLLIRLNNVFPGMPWAPYLAYLENAVASDSRIRIVTEKMSYPEVLSLYASADIYVSLHRSEGLGLGPLEAMALGKPVIATGWSGNMTYMDHTNACLVPYKLIPVEGSVAAYSTERLAGLDAVWADPDLDEAATWMRRLADNSELREEIGRKAAASIADLRDIASEVKFADQIRAIWEHRQLSGLIPDHNLKLDALRDSMLSAPTRPEGAMVKFRRRIGRFLDDHGFGDALRP